MPTIAQRQPAPTLIRDSLPLPATFPDLPDDVMKRFPSLADWQANKDKWWRKAFVALQDSNGSVSQTVTNTRANQDSLRAQFISTSGTFTASLATEITIRANADAALATRATNLEASVDTPTTGLLARVTLIETTYATTTSVSAAISAAISAEVTNRNTAITASAASLTSAYVAADSVLNTALGTRITALEASVDTPTTGLLARVTTIETTYATTTSVSAAISTAISSEITNRNTAISVSASSLTTAYTAADSTLNTALSGSISTLSATVSSNNTTLTTAVTNEASARATADGFLAGKYTLKVAAGDVVTGMNITSSTGAGTDVSDVTFVAANFKIYNGTTGVTMFNVSGSTVQLAGALTVSTSGKVFIGTGTYGNTNTSFYVDSAGQFSLKDKLTWDGSTLTINGGGTFSGALSAASGTFSGALSAATGSFSGSITSSSGTIGGFTLGASSLSAGSGITYVELNSSSANGITIGDPSGIRTQTYTTSFGPQLRLYNAANNIIANVAYAASGGGFLAIYSTNGYSRIQVDGDSATVTFFEGIGNQCGQITVGSHATHFDMEKGRLTTGGITCRNGTTGTATGNQYNLYWNATQVELWIDVSNIGKIALAGTYTASTVTHDSYVTMKDSSGTDRKFMVGT